MAPFLFAVACTIFCEISDNRTQKEELKIEALKSKKNLSNKEKVLKMLEEHKLGNS